MRRILGFWPVRAAGCCLVLSVLALQSAPAQTTAQYAKPPAASKVEPLRTASDRPVDISNIRLDVRVDLEKKTLDGKAAIEFRCIRPTRFVRLDAVHFVIKHVARLGADKEAAEAPHSYDGKNLTVDLGSRWSAGQSGTLNIEYRITDPADGLFFHGPNKADPDEPLMVYSQGEAITNRYWMPCIDEPDQRQTTEVVATVPEGFEAVSNGKLVQRNENADEHTVTFDWRQDIPHPAYLVTLVVRQFDVVHEEWDGIPVDYYVPKGRKDEVLPTYGRTRDMLSFFSERFGVHYPWAKYAQVSVFQFPGGMENTSATTMGDFVLLDQRSLLDRTSEWIVSHEMAHQWWGDTLTCRDWTHTWLNEGFASYAEALWLEHSKGADEYANNMFERIPRAVHEGKSRPVMDRHYTHANSMFDGRTYPKGAWVLHMLRNQLGEEAFWTGFRRYATEHKFQSVETVDFRRSLEHATGRDLERFFYDWLERPGNPDLEVTTEYEAGNQQAAITVKQTQQGEPFQFPLTIVLHQTGSSVPVVVAQQITEKEISLRIPLAGLLTRVDVDPDLAVLTELKENKTRDLWRAQLLEGQGVPARLRAAHHFAASKSDQDRELLARAFAGEKFWAVKIELAKALGGTGAIVSRTALLDGLQNDDARVRRACVDSLGSFKGDGAAVKAITEILQKGDPSYAVEAAALKAYAKLGQEDAIATITPWLSKPSHQNVLAVAALEALGTTQLKPALSILLQWAAPGHAANLRRAAQGALAQMAQSKIVTDAERRHIVKLIIKDLEESRGFGRLSALGALATLGPVAAAELPVVEKIFAESPEGLMHMIAEGIVNGMRQSAKAQSRPAAPPAEANQLREEVTRLNVEKEELRKRLEKYEKAGAAK